MFGRGKRKKSERTKFRPNSYIVITGPSPLKGHHSWSPKHGYVYKIASSDEYFTYGSYLSREFKYTDDNWRFATTKEVAMYTKNNTAVSVLQDIDNFSII